MSLDTQKLDPNQRQQIMASVQQQLALQNAQELLQVRVHWKGNHANGIFLRRNYRINALKPVFKSLEVLSPVPNKFVRLIILIFYSIIIFS